MMVVLWAAVVLGLFERSVSIDDYRQWIGDSGVIGDCDRFRQYLKWLL
jgi:hypothetical protein